MNSPACVRTEELTFHYDEEIPALNGITIEIPDNTYLAIVGQNGSGKTTLVKHFNGLLKPTTGQVWVYGQDTRTTPVSQLAKTVGYVFQNPDHQIFCASTREEISFGPRNLGLDAEEVRARTEEALKIFDLAQYAEIPPAVLGFGLRRKVSVAAVYAMRPQVLILDEPTAGLDWRSTCDLMQLTDDLHRQGHTIILVSHDMRIVAEHAHETLVMHEGRVLAQGPTRGVFQRADELRRAQIAPPQITQLGRRLSNWGLTSDLLTVSEFSEAYKRLYRAQP